MSTAPRNPPAPLTLIDKLRALLRFSRPHTVIATTCQVVGVFIIAAAAADSAAGWPAILLWTWLGSQAANLYVVGLNQIIDVPIDRLNKPALPLASGELTRQAAVWLVVGAGLAALLIGAAQSVYLLLTLSAVMALGTVYSLPPWRLKGRPVWAAVSIALARGIIANLGLYLHYRHTLFSSPVSAAPPPVWALPFFFGFGLVIALFKDIPDHDGDGQFGVRTLAVRWGRRRVFQLGRALLTALYLAALVAAVVWPASAGGLLVPAHLVALFVFLVAGAATDPDSPPSMMRLYLLLWVLFYAEYGFLALHALTA